MSTKKTPDQRTQTGKNGSWFVRMARNISHFAGSSAAFSLALGFIVIWAITGPIFGYSDTWQLVINTATTIITFLMVFLIQNTQNRDSAAVQVKLDELIVKLHAADNSLLDLEELEEVEIIAKKAAYLKIAERERTKGGEQLPPSSTGSND